MTNSPGWASPGSAEPPEPDSGDSPATPPATAEAGSDAVQDPGPEPTDAPVPAQAPPAPEQRPGSGWSSQQPPAGQWHTPSGAEAPGEAPVQPAPPAPDAGQPTAGWGYQWAPPPPPQEGGPRWGPAAGQHGWQPGYAYPAVWQAPKPGVVPLRPLDAGEILSGALAVVRQHWRTAVLLLFGVAVLTQTGSALIGGFLSDDSRIKDLNDNPDPTPSDILHAFSGSTGATALIALLSIVGLIIASGLLTVVTSRAVLGRPAGLRSVWAEIRPRFPYLLGLALVIPLGFAALLAVLVLPGALMALSGAEDAGIAFGVLGVLAGCIIYVRQWNLWSLAAPALLLEGQGIKEAMRRSAKLVNGAWWRVFGVQLLVTVVTALASFILQLPFSAIAATTDDDGMGTLFAANTDTGWTAIIIMLVGGVIATSLTLPVSAGAVSLLYIDQRIRREALDVDLARAANVPGYETRSSAAPAGAHH